MNLDGEYTIPASRQNVWHVLLDPALLARILPGCEKLEPLGEDRYQAAVKIQIGPLQGAFEGTITLSDIAMPDSYRMEFDGRGALGFVKGHGVVHLTEQGRDTTIQYTGEAATGGRIASVGQRLMEASARALIEETLEAITPIAQTLTPAEPAPVDAPIPPAAERPEVSRPGQMSFALGVLRHMFENAVPAAYRLPVLIGAGLIVLAIIAWLLSLFRGGA